MGIIDEIYCFFGRIGFGSFPTQSWDLYKQPATNFLAIVIVHYPKASSDASKRWISFFIGGQHHKLSMHQLDGIYGFPRRRDRDPGAVEDPDEFWATIGSGIYAVLGNRHIYAVRC